MRSLAITIILLLFGAVAAHAEPYEFIGCNFGKGKGTADLERWVASYKSVLDSANDSYRAVVLTPQYADGDNLPDFFWMGIWPDAAKMAMGLGNWFEKGAGDKAMAALAKIADCPTSSLWWGKQVYQAK